MDTIHDILHSLINHLIPHEGNDYRPHLLQRGAIILMLILILLSFLAANFQALLWQSSDWLVGAILPAVVVDLTNTKRADLALPPLTRNAVLDEVATLKAQDMAKYSYFAHNSPTGVTPWYWFQEAGYQFSYAGENLAVYFSDSSELVDAWMNSPTHRANMVGSQYREIGVGTARGMYNGFETIFVVQMFGTPAVAPVVTATPTPTQAAASPLAVATNETTSDVMVEPNVTVAPLVAGEATETVAVNAELPPPEMVPAAGTPSTAVAVPPATSLTDTNAPEAVSDSGEVATTPATFAEEARTVIGAAEAVSLYSGLAASTSNLQPAPYAAVDLENAPVPKVAALATEPSKLLQLIYLILGGITALVLLLSVVLEWRHHRPVQTAYGLGLLLIMVGLFYIHTTIIAGAVIPT